mmetsp:Transcript_104289/g.270356  ORF Transcript_104289/g.270356 Transcript_104289/m.270356 type:complete len:205 (-) Transcript_104289:28-642(-)
MRRRSDEGHMPRLKPAQKGRHQSAARPLRKWPISYLRVQWMQAAAKALHYSSGPELLRDDVIVLDDHVLDVICPESHRSEVGQAHLYRLDHGLILRITAFGGGAVIAGGGGGGGPVFHSRPLHQALLPTFAGGASTSKPRRRGFHEGRLPRCCHCRHRSRGQDHDQTSEGPHRGAGSGGNGGSNAGGTRPAERHPSTRASCGRP